MLDLVEPLMTQILARLLSMDTPSLSRPSAQARETRSSIQHWAISALRTTRTSRQRYWRMPLIPVLFAGILLIVSLVLSCLVVALVFLS